MPLIHSLGLFSSVTDFPALETFVVLVVVVVVVVTITMHSDFDNNYCEDA